jgi:hypothetical protein
MIPFFQYFTDDNINRGVQVPFQGISPFIDYSNASFNFIDNISIGLDSIQTQNSNTTISGVGIGIGSGIDTNTIYTGDLLSTVSFVGEVAGGGGGSGGGGGGGSGS